MADDYPTTSDVSRAHALLAVVLPPIVAEATVLDLALDGGWVEAARGQALVSEGDALPSVWILEQGEARAYSLAVDGRRLGYRIIGAGEVIGLAAAWDQGPAAAAVVCANRCSVLRIGVHTLRRATAHDPALACWVLDRIATDYRAATHQTIQALRSARERIACVLLQMAFVTGSRASSAEIGPTTRREIADLAGVTQETAIRTLRAMETEGLVTSNRRRIRLIDRRQLQDALGCEACNYPCAGMGGFAHPPLFLGRMTAQTLPGAAAPLNGRAR